MHSDITYTEKDNRWFAIREGKVVARSKSLEALEAHVKRTFNDFPEGGGPDMGGGHPIDGPTEMPPPPQGMGGDICLGCGQPLEGQPACANCGTPAGEDPAANDPYTETVPFHDPGMAADAQRNNPHTDFGPGSQGYTGSITTPNGLTGKVLGKVAGLWGDEVTIRLENGRIVRLPVTQDLKIAKTAAAKTTPMERFDTRLASSVTGTRDSLVDRREELVIISAEARETISGGVSFRDARELDRIVVTADAEIAEVDEAIDHLDAEETKAYAPPAPFSMGAASHTVASLGGRDASWLDETVNEMIHEAESTDFKRLMDEGPEALTAELADAALADAGTVRAIASSFVRSKTAGTDPAARDPYEKTFLARVEALRRSELTSRKQTTHKEAAAKEDLFKDAPDESLFL